MNHISETLYRASNARALHWMLSAAVLMPVPAATQGVICSSVDGPFCFPLTGNAPPAYLEELRQSERNTKENAVRAGVAPDALEAILSTVAERLRSRGNGKLLETNALNKLPPREFLGGQAKEKKSPPEARIIVMMEEEGDDGRVRLQNREFVFTEEELGGSGEDIETMKHRLRTKLHQLGANVPEELLHHVVRGFKDEAVKQEGETPQPGDATEDHEGAPADTSDEGTQRRDAPQSRDGPPSASSVLQLQDRLRMLRHEHEITMQQRRAPRKNEDGDNGRAEGEEDTQRRQPEGH